MYVIPAKLLDTKTFTMKYLEILKSNSLNFNHEKIKITYHYA